MTDQTAAPEPPVTESLPATSGPGPVAQLAIAAGILSVAAGVVVLILGFGSVPLVHWKSLITLGRFILGGLLIVVGCGTLLPATRKYALGFIVGSGLSLAVIAWFNGYPGRTVIPGIVLVVAAAVAAGALFTDRKPTVALGPFAAIGIAALVLLILGLVFVEIRFIVRHEVRDSLKPISEKPAASILLALSLVAAIVAVAASDLRTAGSMYLGVAAAHFWSFTPIVALLKYAHYHPELGFWFLFAVPVVLAISGGVMVVMGATQAEMTAGPGVVSAPTP
ncbi:MAG: hypothetical protein ABR579_07070 [Actinomycetota bacterium]